MRLIRPYFRALLAPAALAAAIALAGCNANDIPTDSRALAPLPPRILALMKSKDMDKYSPILIRIFKEESEMEVWKKNRDGKFALLTTFPICRWSGALGPKRKQGDRQAPEGFYAITPAQMNPNSHYYLAFNTGYPNAYDRSWGRTGSELMVHGDCSSAGCYAMTDKQIQVIYALARDAFFGGQSAFQLEAFPFRMTALNMAKHRNNPNFAFWTMIKQGYDDFNATHEAPKVAVCDRRYVFDSAPPAGVKGPLHFYPNEKCPAYRLNPQIAVAVSKYRRQQQVKLADYIAEGVPTVPILKGIDGGMNPVFAEKLAALGDQRLPGDVYDVYGKTSPGELQHIPNPPVPLSELQGRLPPGAPPPNLNPTQGTAAPAVATEPAQPAPTTPAALPATSSTTQMANVPLAKPAAPQPKRTAVAGFFHRLFGGSAQAAQPAASQVTDSGESAKTGATNLSGNTELAANPGPARAASAPVVLHRDRAYPTRRTRNRRNTEAHNVPATPKPAAQQAAKKRAAPAATPQLRTAYSTPSFDGYGLITGAKPLLPAGSFAARWYDDGMH